MALDATTLARIREHVGSTPDDTTVEAVYGLDGNGTVETTALSILRTRYADLVAKAAEFNVEGDYSQNAGKNIDALAAKIAELEQLVGSTGGQVTAGLLRRSCASHVR